jgi:2,3-bisphosphoglycerate-dependent phosphoglycerate mutase
MELLLIRHAQPARQVLDSGVADPPLHERGYEQAARLAEWLVEESIDALVVSPLLRARETAVPVAEATGLVPVVNDGIAEYDRSSSWYIPLEELKAEDNERWKAIVSGDYFDADEDAASFDQRVSEAVGAVVAAHGGHRVAVICHGGVINHYLCDVLGMAPSMFFEPRYASISRVAASRGGIRTLISLNETGHLRGLPGF